MRSTILVGGQAVIEGVMMRVPGAYATAVRAKDGTIKIDYHPFESIITQYKFLTLPIIRGMIHLYESMKIGYGTLQWSADISEPEANKPNKFLDAILSLLSIILAIGLFFALPLILANFFLNHFSNSNDNFIFNIISGLVRISLFLIYLISISFLEDVYRLFQFHGAEHKTVYNFESGKNINIENAQSFSKEHPRCGTSFVFIVMLVSIFSFTIIDSMIMAVFNMTELTVVTRLLFHIPCIPLVAGFSYEVLKIIAKYQKYFLFKIFAYPGLLLQKITTKNPDDSQLEVAISALKNAFGDRLSEYEGKEFNADAIG
tara:strand:+ start:1162 stop:2109 length:948 start_codon:yes stop_codon:yes gene_type:complete